MMVKLVELRYFMDDDLLRQFNQSVWNELFNNIVPFWTEKTVDHECGGFYGRISNDLKVERKAPKSIILTARILWTFASLYEYKPQDSFQTMADHAYRFIHDKFLDREYGGTYWMVDYKGEVLTDKKKIYGQAFSIYSLAQYYAVTKNESALKEAQKIFRLIEKYNHDKVNYGYLETSNRDWTIAEEMRLSEIDMNEMKSMNTHLHLMEAYAMLYRVWPDKRLREKLYELIVVFRQFIIDPQTMHFKLFFDEKWYSKSQAISFGHDIEGSWLLCEAAEALNDSRLLAEIKEIALAMCNVSMEEGFSKHYSIYTEQNGSGKIYRESHWWQQAEAVVGFVNAYQLSKNEVYLKWALNCWKFITEHFVDKKNGEWFYEIDSHRRPDRSRYKVSEWKGPYHNGRACLEILKRLKTFSH